MRRTSPPANSHAHQHDWWVVEDDSGICYEDGAAHLVERCTYVEQKGHHSSRHDEVFYETKYECGEERVHRFDLTTVEKRHDSHVSGTPVEYYETLAEGRDAIHDLYDADPSSLEEIEVRAAERLVDDGELFDRINVRSPSGGKWTMDVQYGGETYRLHYEWTEVNRL